MAKEVKEHDLLSEEQRSRPGPTAAELRGLAERLRAIAKAIFQSGKLDIPFAKNEFATIFSPLVAGWYSRANALHDEEQKRLFEAVASLVKLRSGVAVDSPVERLKSIADDCDALAATLEPQSATAAPNVLVTIAQVANTVGLESKSMTDYVREWGQPFIKHRGQRPAKYKLRAIEPTLKRQFADVPTKDWQDLEATAKTA